MECPKQKLHTKGPVMYVKWHEWAEKKSRRHYQVQCPGCGRYAIWKRKKPNEFTNEEPIISA